jgi:hypothetical protein
LIIDVFNGVKKRHKDFVIGIRSQTSRFDSIFSTNVEKGVDLKPKVAPFDIASAIEDHSTRSNDQEVVIIRGHVEVTSID